MSASTFRSIGFGWVCLLGWTAVWAVEPLPEGLYVRLPVVRLVDPCQADGAAYPLALLEEAVSVGSLKIAAQTRWPLLPTHALEGIERVAQAQGWRRWRLSGRLTRYRGQNYLFVDRGWPLLEPAAENRSDAADPNQAVEGLAEAAEVLGIPVDLLRRVESRPETPPEMPSGAISSAAADSVVVDRVGSLRWLQDRWVFQAESLDRRVGTTRVEVLPSQVRQWLEPPAWSLESGPLVRVAAIQTRYHDRDLWLLLRAVPVYDYGNFVP